VAGNLDPVAVAKQAANEALVAGTDVEQVADAFERVDGAIDAWQLNTVDEEEEGEESGGEGDAGADGTFLTGIGLEEKRRRKNKAEEEEPAPAPPPEPAEPKAPERELWEDVDDPTERLALALGLDPRHLAMHTGRHTVDAAGSVNALRFALAHPLVGEAEGLRPPEHHLELTAAARAKRRARSLAPLPGLRAVKRETTPDVKTVRMQTMEGMLAGMKERLAGLEANLNAKLATVLQPEKRPPLRSKNGGGEGDGGRTPGDDFAPIAAFAPERLRLPLSIEHEGPDDDARSETMSALAEDVVDAVENPAHSDIDEDADNYLVEDDEENGEAGDSQRCSRLGDEAGGDAGDSRPSSRMGAAGVGPAAAAQAFGPAAAAAFGKLATEAPSALGDGV
jgi:hypothetical protein